jgi:predicted PurR-regulated permease PerM
MGEILNSRSSDNSAPAAAPLSLILVGVAVSLALVYFLRSILVPFSVALFLVTLIDGLVHALAHRWSAGPRWVLITGAGAIIIVLLAVCAITLGYGATRLAAYAPDIVSRVDTLIGALSQSAGLAQPPRIADLANVDWIVSLATPLASGLGNFFAGVTLTALFLGFMLASHGLLARKLEILAGSEERTAKLLRVLDRISRSASDYVWVQTVAGGIIAIASGIALYIIGLQDVLFWTILIFLLTYIPVLGPTIASIAVALFALIQFSTYWQAIAAFAAVQVVSNLVGSLLQPKMQADKQNLDPTISIFSIALWTLLWGVQGTLLAIPLTVMLMIVFNQFEATRWAAVLIANDGVPESSAPDQPKSPTPGA